MDQNWWRQEYVRAITKINFNYTGSPGEKILQKVLGGATFLTHIVFSKITKSIDFVTGGKGFERS